MKLKKTQNQLIILIVILTLGAILRFYKLDWGDGLFTHPDEYHLIISVNQLSFPSQMNPHFFSYGTVTIYLIYFTKLLISSLNPFIIGRFYSAFFSTITILLVYKISLTFLTRRYALLAAFLVSITPGLIQQAHFATPESNLTFFILLSLLSLIYLTQKGKFIYLLLASISLGLALGVKVSGTAFFLPLLITFALKLWRKPLKLILSSVVSALTVIATLFIIDPYIFLDFQSFWSNFIYESSLARGDFIVFYTRQFIDTIPFLFQLERILPLALGPAILIFGLLGLALLVIAAIKKSGTRNLYLLLLISFLSLLIPNALLFAKWTRFLAPTFPFFAIFASFLLYKFSSLKPPKFFSVALYSTLLTFSIIWSLAFFSIYQKQDIRIIASTWLEKNTLPSTFLVEGGNMIDLPLKGSFTRISFDFYTLEENPLAKDQLFTALTESDYFLIESRRVFLNHKKDLYPQTARFYKALFSGNLGFEEIKEFNSYPSLSLASYQLELPDEMAEESWSVFDHPVIRIFKKNAKLTKEDYAQILQN